MALSFAKLRLYLSVYPHPVGQNKSGQQLEKKSQEVYISRIRGATPSGLISIELGK